MKRIGGNTTADLQKLTVEKNDIGEPVRTWVSLNTQLNGWLDLQSGTKNNELDTWLQESTHIFVMDYVDLSALNINLKKPENLRLVIGNETYEVMTIDNPMQMNYQLEIYLKYSGWQ